MNNATFRVVGHVSVVAVDSLNKLISMPALGRTAAEYRGVQLLVGNRGKVLVEKHSMHTG
jgi:hypothetical protein